MLRMSRAGMARTSATDEPVAAADPYPSGKPAGAREPVPGPGNPLPASDKRQAIRGLSNAGLIMSLARGRDDALPGIYSREETCAYDTGRPADLPEGNPK
jgi:hypothetical protein